MTPTSVLPVINFVYGAGTLLLLAYAIALTFSSKQPSLLQRISPIALIIASVFIIIGPLTYQYYLGFPVCSMCWYQRIFMWPIAFMILGTLLPGARAGRRHVLSAIKWLAPAGLFFSIWHYISQWGITSTSAACGAVGQSVSCDGIDVIIWGFMTIPLMAGLGFISLFLIIRAYTKK